MVEVASEFRKCDRTRLMILVPTMALGGVERCTELLLRHFRRELFELHLVTIFDHELFYKVPSDVNLHVLERYVKPQITSHFEDLPSHIKARYYDELVWLEATASRLDMLIRKVQPNVVLAQDYFASAIALLTKKYLSKGLKVIASAHNEFSKSLQVDKHRDLHAALIQHCFNEANGIIAISQGAAEDLTSCFGVRPDMITVINGPIDLEEIENLAKEPVMETNWFSEEVPIVLFLGRITPQKGLVYLLQATALARKLQKFRCVIIGDGEQRKELELLARKLDIAEDVLFLKIQDNPYKFLCRATCFVLPSVFDGMPCVIQEAMACGCPVIATDCASGVRELLGEGRRGVLVPPKAPHAMVDAILEVIRKSKLRQELIQTGLRYVKQFATERIVGQYEDFVNTCASVR